MQDIPKCPNGCQRPTGFQNACPKCGNPYYDFDESEGEGLDEL